MLVQQGLLVAPGARTVPHAIDLTASHPVLLQEALVDSLPADMLLHNLTLEHIVRDLFQCLHLVPGLLACLPLGCLASKFVAVLRPSREVPTMTSIIHVNEETLVILVHDKASRIAFVPIVQPPCAVACDGGLAVTDLFSPLDGRGARQLHQHVFIGWPSIGSSGAGVMTRLGEALL